MNVENIHVDKRGAAAPKEHTDTAEQENGCACCSNGGECCGNCGSEAGNCGGNEECGGSGSCGSYSCGRWHCVGKWILGAAVVMFLGVWSAAKVAEVKRFHEYPPAGVQEHSVTVSATGKSSVSPDTAEIELSVLTEGKTPPDVQKENAQKMNAITDFVKSNNILAKDIKTATYSLYPKYEYTKGQSNIVGYTLTQTLRVKVHDLASVGILLEGATGRGANQVGDVRFFVDEPEKFQKEARAEAFAKVKVKAREISQAAGVRLGDVITFSESGGEVPPPVFYGKADALGTGGAGAPPQLEGGSQDVTVTVTVTYAIE